MPNEEEPLGPKKTAIVLVIVVGCFAVLWPRIIYPLFAGNVKDQIQPNHYDKAAGCCDMIFETDVNAIAIMSELCLTILRNKSANIDERTLDAFSTRKLPRDIIAMCRKEVNATCGVDISTFLDQNVKLGKSYKQILEEVRSYNSSTCLKMNFGLPTWVLSSHTVATRLRYTGVDSVKQERPAYPRAPLVPAALKERGRALPPSTPQPQAAPPAATPMPGRPLPIHAARMRPPLGAGGGPVPQQRSTTTGFLLPLYTLAICVFFVYTLFKILFKRTAAPPPPSYETVDPDPGFRRRVFDCRHSSTDHRCSPEKPLVVTAISGLVAEVRQQMEDNYAANSQHTQEHVDEEKYHSNGGINHRRSSPPVHIVAEPLIEEPKAKTPKAEVNPTITLSEPITERNVTNPPITLVEAAKKAIRDFDDNMNNANVEPVERKNKTYVDYVPRVRDDDSPNKLSSGYKTVDTIIQELLERNILDKDEAENLFEDRSSSERALDAEPVVVDENTAKELADALREDTPEKERLSGSEDDERHSPAEIKVVGVESTSVGAPWHPPEPQKPSQSHQAQEVNSIFLDGEIPLQSRVLVADSETSEGTPIVTSKVTLSLINDQDAHALEQEDDFTTADAITLSKNEDQQGDDLSEEEIEEEEEEIEEEEVEIEEIEESEEDIAQHK